MSRVQVIEGDCNVAMSYLYEEGVRVHACVTSPPYWGLRDYGHPGQLGLEATPEEYVAKMVEVFRWVRRMLRDDGTLWLNLGDSYAGSGKGGNPEDSPFQKQSTNRGSVVRSKRVERGEGSGRWGGGDNSAPGCKPKDLVGIPWMVAFALRADGWYLRSDIIWSKPNPMPESVTDRPTKAHEYIFLLSKSPTYYYDNEAIREPLSIASIERLAQPNIEQQVGSARVPGKTNGNMKAVSRKSGNKTRKYGEDVDRPGSHLGRGIPWEGDTRNKRSVWTVTTKPFREAHFATFPPDLIEPCILAGAPIGGTVLDPFGGSGTTGEVASKHGRDAILIELNPEYAEMAERRVANAPMSLFAPESGAA